MYNDLFQWPVLWVLKVIYYIVFKPDMGVDQGQVRGHELSGLTQVNSG
jgi:hypothetical protein